MDKAGSKMGYVCLPRRSIQKRKRRRKRKRDGKKTENWKNVPRENLTLNKVVGWLLSVWIS